MSGRNLPNLDKIFRDEHEPDFPPSGGSNIAAIFGVKHKVQLPVKQTGLKKPSNTVNVSHVNPLVKTEVIVAKAVNAFKLTNGQYTAIGRLGMALTGNISTKLYQIILYRSKQEHLSVVTITCDFTYSVQANNYASYYDSNNENWSIHFGNKDAFAEFAREIGLAKYFSKQGKLDNNVMYQDLSPIAEDIVAKEWDNIEIQYSINTEIIQPCQPSQSLQTMKVQISTDDSWERSLLGISKGVKRVLFVPPSKQISLGPSFPKEADIMLEIEVMNIQTPDENALPKPAISSKADILSRMAKMGQSILPSLQTSTTDSEDTEEDAPCYKSPQQKKEDAPCYKSPQQKKEDTARSKSPQHKKTDSNDSHTRRKDSVEEIGATQKEHVTTKPLSTENSESCKIKPVISATNFSSTWPSTCVQPHYVTFNKQMNPLGTHDQSTVPPMPVVMDPTLNIVLSESRVANAEIRMGMSKIADNVQKLLDKFHTLELYNAHAASSGKTMDATLKMLLAMNSTFDKKKDNECSQTVDNVTDNTSRLEDCRDKMVENESKFTAEAVESMQKEICKSKNKIVELEESLKESTDTLKKTLEDLKDSQDLATEYRTENTVLQHKNVQLTTQCVVLQSKIDRENEKKTKEIKQIMTETYHTLLEKFTEESYASDYVKMIIAETIKNVTLKILGASNINESKLSESSETDRNHDTSEQFPKIEPDTSEEMKSFDEPPPIPPLDDTIDDF